MNIFKSIVLGTFIGISALAVAHFMPARYSGQSIILGGQVSVPTAATAGWMLVSSSSGAYYATTTWPLIAGTFYATSTNSKSVFPYASTTAISGTNLSFTNSTTTSLGATSICFTGDTCRTTWPTSGSGSGAATTSFAATAPIQVSSNASAITYSILASSASQAGSMSAADFQLLHTATTTFTSPLIYTIGTNAVTCQVATASVPGCLAAADFATFSAKLSSYNPFVTLSTFGTTTAATNTPIWTQGVFFSSSTRAASQFPYASSTGITASYASTTALTVSTSLTVPFATAPTLTQLGLIAINSTATAASSSLQYYDGNSATRLLPDVRDMAMTFVNTPTNGTGTTTIARAPSIHGIQVVGAYCWAMEGSGNKFTARIGTGAASSTFIQSSNSATAIGFNSFTQSFNAGQSMYVEVGTFASSGTTTATCNFPYRVTY